MRKLIDRLAAALGYHRAEPTPAPEAEPAAPTDKRKLKRQGNAGKAARRKALKRGAIPGSFDAPIMAQAREARRG